jgi:hypothetical protein
MWYLVQSFGASNREGAIAFKETERSRLPTFVVGMKLDLFDSIQIIGGECKLQGAS